LKDDFVYFDGVVIAKAHDGGACNPHARGVAGSYVLHELRDVGLTDFRADLELDDGIVVDLHVQPPHVHGGGALLHEAVDLREVGHPPLVEVRGEHFLVEGLRLAATVLRNDPVGKNAH
jgi:hypothetical protein